MSLYQLFGLVLDSEVSLPELRTAAAEATVDVVIRRGGLATGADLVIPDVCSFAVRDGREIVVDALPGVPERNVRLYLLGSAMGLLLHQRGLFPLHANAVAVGGHAVAVAGASGAGKSTLAAWFARNGQSLVGDDVIVLRPAAKGTMALPGPPRIRLWREALNQFGLSSDGLEQSYVEADFDKWDLPVARHDQVEQELPLAAIYVLEDGPDFAMVPVSGAAAAALLFDHTYRGAFLERTGGAVTHWQTVAALAASIPIFTLSRPRDLSRLDALGRLVLDHARQVVRTSGAGR